MYVFSFWQVSEESLCVYTTEDVSAFTGCFNSLEKSESMHVFLTDFLGESPLFWSYSRQP